MSGFSAQWLALREPLDSQSRDGELCTRLLRELQRTHSDDTRFEVVDLGAGTGANLRYLAPRLGGCQDWLLVESDLALLAAMAGCMRGWSRNVTTEAHGFMIHETQFECRVQPQAVDLARQLDRLQLTATTLLTSSALLDLVSEPWLQQLAARAAAAGAAILFVLTYDGRIVWEPAEAEDEEVRTLFNRHQLGDKGFGLALGPAAAHRAMQIFRTYGYAVHCAPSDWLIGPEQQTLQHALLAGWHQAACELAPDRAVALDKWLSRRRRLVEGGRAQCRVGHTDIAGTWSGP